MYYHDLLNVDNFTYESVNYPTLIVLTNQENKYFKKFFINKLKVNHTDKFDITLDTKSLRWGLWTFPRVNCCSFLPDCNPSCCMKVCERFIKIKRVKSCSHKGSRFYKTSTELSKTLANEIWHTQSSGLHLVVHSNHSPKVKMATKWHDCGLTSIFLWQAYSCAHIDVRSPLSWNWSHSNAYGWHHEACMCLPFKSWKSGSAFSEIYV